MNTLQNTVDNFWLDILQDDVLAMDADSHCGEKVLALIEAAEALLELCPDLSDAQRNRITDGIQFQASVIVNG